MACPQPCLATYDPAILKCPDIPANVRHLLMIQGSSDCMQGEKVQREVQQDYVAIADGVFVFGRKSCSLHIPTCNGTCNERNHNCQKGRSFTTEAASCRVNLERGKHRSPQKISIILSRCISAFALLNRLDRIAFSVYLEFDRSIVTDC